MALDPPIQEYSLLETTSLVSLLMGVGTSTRAAWSFAGVARQELLSGLETLGKAGAVRLGAGAPATLEAGGQVASQGLQKIAVIGSRADTLVAKGWPGHVVLDVPGWSPVVNKSWVRWIVKNGLDVYLASPMNRQTLWNVRRKGLSIFAQEIRQLLNAGYRKVGQYLLPP